MRIYPALEARNLSRAMRKQESLIGRMKKRQIEIKRTYYPFVQSIESANTPNQRCGMVENDSDHVHSGRGKWIRRVFAQLLMRSR